MKFKAVISLKLLYLSLSMTEYEQGKQITQILSLALKTFSLSENGNSAESTRHYLLYEICVKEAHIHAEDRLGSLAMPSKTSLAGEPNSMNQIHGYIRYMKQGSCPRQRLADHKLTSVLDSSSFHLIA